MNTPCARERCEMGVVIYRWLDEDGYIWITKGYAATSTKKRNGLHDAPPIPKMSG